MSEFLGRKFLPICDHVLLAHSAPRTSNLQDPNQVHFQLGGDINNGL